VIAQVATRAARLIDLDLTFRPDEITNDDAYIGNAYGALTPASVAALRLAARTEGLLLDPTYTAKALAGLVDHSGRDESAETSACCFCTPAALRRCSFPGTKHSPKPSRPSMTMHCRELPARYQASVELG
jgi:hypothetical protein